MTLEDIHDSSCTYIKDDNLPENETGIFYAPDYENIPQALKDGKFPQFPQVNTIYDLFECTLKLYPNDPYYGKRVYEEGSFGNSYEWISRTQFQTMRDAIGSFLIEKGAQPNEHIGIFSYDRLEFVVAQHACYSHGFIPVLIPNASDQNKLLEIIKQASLNCIFTVSTKLQSLLTLECDVIKTIIVFDDEESPYDESKLSQPIKSTLIKWNDAINISTRIAPRPPTIETPALIIFSSSTTTKQ